MKKKTPARDLALSILNRLPDRSTRSGLLLDEVFRLRPDLDERDRAFVNHLVQGVFRWRLRLDWYIGQVSRIPLGKIDPPVLNILRLALYQILFLDRVPESAAVDEAVRQAKQGGGRPIGAFVNGVLRTLCRRKGSLPLPEREEDPVLHLAVLHSYPEWLVKKWVDFWGVDQAQELLTAGNQIPGVTLRVNTLRTDRASLIRRLAEEGVAASPTAYSPVGVTVEHFRGKIDRLDCHAEGLYQVQAEAAQISAFFLGVEPGDRVLDVCAGFGGKTTHLAQQMGDLGEILALDMDFRRLVILGENSRRLGVKSIAPLAADASRGLSRLLRSQFDRILVDAPCSGLGVIARHPDVKWNRKEADLARLASLQGAILHEAVGLLRRGGSLLYVTCTLSEEENGGVVSAFLTGHKDLVRIDLRNRAPEWAIDLTDEKGFFRTLPHIHHMDGFFGALFEKT